MPLDKRRVACYIGYMEANTMSFAVDGAAVRRLREAKDWTRDDMAYVARQLGHRLNPRTLAGIENGEGRANRADTLAVIALVLGVTVDSLLVGATEVA